MDDEQAVACLERTGDTVKNAIRGIRYARDNTNLSYEFANKIDAKLVEIHTLIKEYLEAKVATRPDQSESST